MTLVEYQRKGRLATITLNRPEKLNALDAEMLTALRECWLRYRDDDEAWVAILAGADGPAAPAPTGAGSSGRSRARTRRARSWPPCLRIRTGRVSSTSRRSWRAHQVGMLNRVVPDDEVLGTANELAEELLSRSPLALDGNAEKGAVRDELQGFS